MVYNLHVYVSPAGLKNNQIRIRRLTPPAVMFRPPGWASMQAESKLSDASSVGHGAPIHANQENLHTLKSHVSWQKSWRQHSSFDSGFKSHSLQVVTILVLHRCGQSLKLIGVDKAHSICNFFGTSNLQSLPLFHCGHKITGI